MPPDAHFPHAAQNSPRAARRTNRGDGSLYSIFYGSDLVRRVSADEAAELVHHKLVVTGKKAFRLLVRTGVSPEEIRLYMRSREGGSLTTIATVERTWHRALRDPLCLQPSTEAFSPDTQTNRSYQPRN